MNKTNVKSGDYKGSYLISEEKWKMPGSLSANREKISGKLNTITKAYFKKRQKIIEF